MNDKRTNAVIVGVLFIIGTVTGSISAILSNPVLNSPDYLTNISAHGSQIMIAAFLVFLMGIACAGIGLALYPILHQYSLGLAIGAVGFRVIEGMIDILVGVGRIGLLALSQEFIKAGTPGLANFQAIGDLIKAGDAWLSNGASLVCWCIAALMYYAVFYRSQLVPRWISAWGLVGIMLAAIASVLVMLGVIPGFGTVQMIANLPIMPQEMVFAVWLIAKGIRPSEITAPTAKPAANPA